jgi:hypothetical protein
LAESDRRQSAVRALLGIPANLYVAIVLGLGYAESQPAPRKMCTLDEILSWERYGQNG